MATGSIYAVNALNSAYLHNHPIEARRSANRLGIAELLELLAALTPGERLELSSGLTLDRAQEVLQRAPPEIGRSILQHGDPAHTARALVRVPLEERERMLALVDAARQRELRSLVDYPEASAGALMDPRFLPLYASYSVKEALRRIRRQKPRFTRQLYIVDEEGRLQSMVELHKLAMADGSETLGSLSEPVLASVPATATREEVTQQLEEKRITDLPVVDLGGRMIGAIRYSALMEAVREESSSDMQAMVGASRDERALSEVSFVVRKRLPWLSINLLTAFLAAAVVGVFEGTIAQFTALAVLLPVVAGQSGNTGAQALAVTMRGLALREIGTSQWLRVARKEVGAGFINGVAIAMLTATGVLLWSSSAGLAAVIGSSMIIAMVAAGFSGVIIPVVLARLGQDPAQSSSIILTTVTDVVGFFAFLGIATLLMGYL